MKPPTGRRPLIGITPDTGVTRSAHPAPTCELKVAYAEAVVRAGGLPMVLPLTEERSTLDAFLERISGLLITGGSFDVPPELYGQSPREGLGTVKPQRTQFELALLKGALTRRLPVLGICGGMQLLAVAQGGTLIQDLKRERPEAREHEQPQDRAQPHHPVEVKDGTLLAAVMGRGQLMVNSTHHQAVDAPGRDVEVSAVSPDGIIEAIELKDAPFAVGVQWHPEMLLNTVPAHLALYRAFVNKAREGRR